MPMIEENRESSDYCEVGSLYTCRYTPVRVAGWSMEGGSCQASAHILCLNHTTANRTVKQVLAE